MFKKIKIICFALIGFFVFAFSSSLKANDYPSNTGYWVQSGNNTYYCEWSFFEWVCQSGSTSDGPPEESLPEGGN